MKTRKLTAADVREVTGYTRDQLRALLNELPVWSEEASSARVAREYTAHDLIVLSVIYLLDIRVGIRRKQIALMLSHLRRALSGPRNIDRNARLAISFDPRHVAYVGSGSDIQEGVVISLGPVFDRVDQYLGAAHTITASAQPRLQIGPALVRSRRRRAAS